METRQLQPASLGNGMSDVSRPPHRSRDSASTNSWNWARFPAPKKRTPKGRPLIMCSFDRFNFTDRRLPGLATNGVIRGSLLRDLLRPFGPLRNLVLRCEPESFLVGDQSSVSRSGPFCSLAPGSNLSSACQGLAAGRQACFRSGQKNSSGDRQRIPVASIHLTKLEFFGPHIGNSTLRAVFLPQ